MSRNILIKKQDFKLLKRKKNNKNKLSDDNFMTN